MWGKKGRNGTATYASDSTTLVSGHTEIRGDIRFRGVMHVEGRIVGDVQAAEGTLRLVEGGVIEGDINAPCVIINGSVKGDVYATEKLELASNADISGNVYYQVIEMVMGAQVNGSLEHMAPVKAEPKAIEAPVYEGEVEPADLAD